MTLYPQLMVNVRVDPGLNARDVIARDTVTSGIAEVEARLQGRGRVVLRPSGTEPLIRVMVEGPERAAVEALAAELAARVEEAATELR